MKWLVLAVVMLLGGCATAGRVEHCTGWKPIIVSEADVLTDGTSKQILGHDEYGVKSGCWKTPNRARN